MNSSMRQWRRLVLAGMLAWGLLFLALLSYFLDAHVTEPLFSSGSTLSQHPDTRRLASIQASHPQHATTSVPRDKPEQEPESEPEPKTSPSSLTPESSLEVSHSPNVAPYVTYGSQEGHQDYLDPQSLAAWSSFGTENIGSYSDPAVQSRERTSQTTEYQNNAIEDEGEEGDEEEKENEDEDLGNRIRDRRHGGGDSSDLEASHFAKSASVVQRLWRGHVSTGMLSPRLQRAMKNYVNANKHNVSYQGHRRAAQSAKELLCQMKAQAKLRTVDGSEQPFSSLGWARLVPALPLRHLYKQQEKRSFKTCAVVTSAGAILHSRLGREIGKWIWHLSSEHLLTHRMASAKMQLKFRKCNTTLNYSNVTCLW